MQKYSLRIAKPSLYNIRTARTGAGLCPLRKIENIEGEELHQKHRQGIDHNGSFECPKVHRGWVIRSAFETHFKLARVFGAKYCQNVKLLLASPKSFQKSLIIIYEYPKV
jgi:hypothetical protein